MLKLKNNIQRSFNKAAYTYDGAAYIQKQIGHELLQLLPNLPGNRYILDVGCGTGYFTNLIAKKQPKNKIIGIDFASKMLQVAQENYSHIEFIFADFDAMPAINNSVDIIYSNLALQWSLDLATTLAELSRSIKQGGNIYFSTLGPQSFKELRQCWKSIDNTRHTNTFLSQKKIITLLRAAGFIHLHITEKLYLLGYADILQILKTIKDVGANCVLHNQNNHLHGKNLLKKLANSYEIFRTTEQLLPLTYQTFYISAVKS